MKIYEVLNEGENPQYAQLQQLLKTVSEPWERNQIEWRIENLRSSEAMAGEPGGGSGAPLDTKGNYIPVLPTKEWMAKNPSIVKTLPNDALPPSMQKPGVLDKISNAIGKGADAVFNWADQSATGKAKRDLQQSRKDQGLQDAEIAPGGNTEINNKAGKGPILKTTSKYDSLSNDPSSEFYGLPDEAIEILMMMPPAIRVDPNAPPRDLLAPTRDTKWPQFAKLMKQIHALKDQGKNYDALLSQAMAIPGPVKLTDWFRAYAETLPQNAQPGDETQPRYDPGYNMTKIPGYKTEINNLRRNAGL